MHMQTDTGVPTVPPATCSGIQQVLQSTQNRKNGEQADVMRCNTQAVAAALRLYLARPFG